MSFTTERDLSFLYLGKVGDGNAYYCESDQRFYFKMEALMSYKFNRVLLEEARKICEELLEARVKSGD